MYVTQPQGPLVPLLFVQHLDTTLDDRLGHEETRLYRDTWAVAKRDDPDRIASVIETGYPSA